jgi:hypothetical protein
MEDDGTLHSGDTNKFDAVVQALEGELHLPPAPIWVVCALSLLMCSEPI